MVKDVTLIQLMMGHGDGCWQRHWRVGLDSGGGCNQIARGAVAWHLLIFLTGVITIICKT